MKFNLQKFNIKTINEDLVILLSADFKDELISSLYPSIDISANMYVFDSLSSTLDFTIGILSELDLKDSLVSAIFMDTYTPIEIVYKDNLTSECYIEKEGYYNIEFEDSLVSDFILLKNLYFTELFKDESMMKTAGSKELFLNMSYSDVLSSNIIADIFDTEVTTISITIPAGGILEIDSNNYTVYLNNKNVFDSYSGSWVFLDRGVKELVVGVGNGRTIKGNVIYRERYL